MNTRPGLSKQEFIRLTVANTLGEYLRPYLCDPAQIKKAQARCIHDATELADELWGTTEEPHKELAVIETSKKPRLLSR